MGRSRFWRQDEGQSLIEVALFVPLFTLLIIYAVDFGFFFLAATTLTTAARNAASFAIQGVKSPSLAAEPAASLVQSLAIASIGLPNASSAKVQVCSNSVGTPSASNIAQCTSSTYTAGTDPESPIFQLNRVDIVYTVTPPIPLPAGVFPNLTFHRYVEMRAIQ
ncbi:TadE/TadG family type IV pilus assembly protein [Edaphobacter paludis]|uniref:TadE/TadG family type IV pilus assembly protein n=1 Tax=Edaphobacter paludis TaxID=3035702 RepID=A0AAU7D117_9BACT